MKVLFYWNAFLNYPLYDACQTIAKHPQWIFRDKKGEPIYKVGTLEQYNLPNPEFQRWWATIARKGVTEYGCDGIFMDAVNQAVPLRPFAKSCLHSVTMLRHFGQNGDRTSPYKLWCLSAPETRWL